ncbi:hypothetical protein Taro_049216 [Colocasia esculenta]|uniref:Uncharacterized protein n=1 Tax=Colocasia esculenta TaxID=4460 RepID=A0A843XAA8_COLES|nr:hypothetical protein [Colocasia esculenta]
MHQNKVQKIKKSKKNRYLSTTRKAPVDRCIQARKPYLRTGLPVDSTNVACRQPLIGNCLPNSQSSACQHLSTGVPNAIDRRRKPLDSESNLVQKQPPPKTLEKVQEQEVLLLLCFSLLFRGCYTCETGGRCLCLVGCPSVVGDYFTLVSAVVVLPQSLRCAVGLAGAFWRVFPEWCLSGSGGGSPKTYLRCFCSSACCSVLSDDLCCLVVGLCILVKVLPRIAPLLLLVEVLPRRALCLFWATVVLPLWFEVCRLVGLRYGEVLPGWLLALLVEVLPKAASCCFWLSLLSLSL